MCKFAFCSVKVTSTFVDYFFITLDCMEAPSGILKLWIVSWLYNEGVPAIQFTVLWDKVFYRYLNLYNSTVLEVFIQFSKLNFPGSLSGFGTRY